jgi:hypothetical protein
MIRVTTATILAGLSGAMLFPVAAQSASSIRASTETTVQPAGPSAATDLSAQRRPRTRIRIYQTLQPDDVYPRYNPGPNAVRVCNANYVQEFRPSGTVIVPRMSCYWRR